jgi:hypothetical protein
VALNGKTCWGLTSDNGTRWIKGFFFEHDIENEFKQPCDSDSEEDTRVSGTLGQSDQSG